MYFLFSGEGPTDLGLCGNMANACECRAYNHGPMTIIADQIVERKCGHSFLQGMRYGYVSKHELVKRAKQLKANKKAVRIPGKRQPIETRYFFNNARALAKIALQRQQKVKDDVVAVLFRDSDGTASAGRGLWADKRKSMIDGFNAEEFPRGVPMIPKPKSEAWIICAMKSNPYQACQALESRSGNDNSPNSLKGELEGILGEAATRDKLNSLVIDRTIDISRIDMQSLEAFRKRLEEVI
jgi:hypothetical protein